MAHTGLGLTSISDFADELLGEEPGADLASAGPACAELASALPAEQDASSLIATILWDVFSRTFAFQKTIDTVTGGAGTQVECFVVRHPLFGPHPRYDLLVFDPAMRDLEPQVTHLPEDSAWIEQGLNQSEEVGASYSHTYPVDILSAAIKEVMTIQPPGIIIADPPDTIRLCGLGFMVPYPAISVTRHENSERYGSVGVVARSPGGALVVTAALHALRENDGDPISDATEVWLGPTPGAVAASHEITDSAIILPDHPEDLLRDKGRLLNDPLRNVPPREHERMTFEGAGSGEEHPYVTAWSPDLLAVTPYNQAKVLTTPDTVPGDSGAVLFDETENLIGFCFDRSAFNSRPEYSSWIWADSVFSIHQLKHFNLDES
jgi:hypothetical protein